MSGRSEDDVTLYRTIVADPPWPYGGEPRRQNEDSFAGRYQQSLLPFYRPQRWFDRWAVVAVATDGHRTLMGYTLTRIGALRTAHGQQRFGGRHFAFVVERAQ